MSQITWIQRYDQAAARLGRELLPLALDPEAWILRRVEHIAIDSHRVVRRATSLDLALPTDFRRFAVDPSVEGSPIVACLGLFSKRQLIDFSLKEGSHRLSLVRGDVNALIAAEMLWNIAIISDVPAQAADAAIPWFRRIASFDREDSSLAFDELTQNSIALPPVARPVRNCGDVVRTAKYFRDSYFMLVELPPAAGSRRLLKLSTDQALRGGSTAGGSFGLRPNAISLDIPGAAQAGSYHVEVSVPKGCHIRSMSSSADADGTDPTDLQLSLIGRRASRYVRAPAETEPTLEIEVAPERAFFFVPASVIASVISITLIAGTLVSALGGEMETTASALLLSGLSVISGMVVRQEDGPLTVALHSRARAALAVVGTAALGAAATLAFGATKADLSWWWGGWSVVASVATCILLVGLARADTSA